ncbi:hypothetical protein [Palleronia abyssalis]|uniref:Uncharacterized protein n=1 Tax=Palleronia abyssalis TaxID=1501240 RepID=A0A2R8C241_9RHOB|nr:hypothetical protein [Palleronia abyssalis]SPJ26460.1 hypothetical protein PAA8504_04322 [Palleronia abyssalis]
MAKRLPTMTDRKRRKTDEDILNNLAFKKAMEKAGLTGAREARKIDKVQSAANLAIAETIPDWLDWRAEGDAFSSDDFFVEIALIATPGNRSRIMKHAMITDEALEAIESQVAEWKDEADRERTRQSAKPLSPEADPVD